MMPLDVVISETGHERRACINRYTSHESLMCHLVFLHSLILFLIHALFWFERIMCRSKDLTELVVIGVYV
jgi:hypothetical protein